MLIYTRGIDRFGTGALPTVRASAESWSAFGWTGETI